MIFVLFLFIIFPSSFAQSIPTCAASVTCPTGGIWSEWTTVGNGVCPTKCGSCSKLYQTRVCLGERINCQCTGALSRLLPCNTSPCAYPSQRSCCLPHLIMRIGGTMQCGPLPPVVNKISCCKTGGFWTEWTGYGRNDDDTAWVRTRECVSEEAGCPCTGSKIETSTDCPCKMLQNIGKMCDSDWGAGTKFPIYNIDHKNCYLVTEYEATNAVLNWCQPLYPNNTLTYGLVAFQDPSGKCSYAKQFQCDGKPYQQLWACDLKTHYWINEHDGQPTIAVNQMIYKYNIL